jgi:uncharacterized protein YggE
MFGPQQAVTNPFGITVFGSSITRVPPDIASIKAAVSIVEQKPADAFSISKKHARAVQELLRKQNVAEFGTSRVALTRTIKMVNGVQQFAGYQARITLSILLKELDRVDELAEGLVSAGANEIERIGFETTKLKEVRAEARRMAMTAALEKAQNYCAAGGVQLGRILHIEDVNPLTLQAGMARGAHGAGTSVPEFDGDVRAFDPSLIEIGAAVFVSYEFKLT